MKKSIKALGFFTNQNLEQGAEFLIEDERFDDQDIFVIINKAGNMFVQKHGKDKAMKVLSSLNRPEIITKQWLSEVFEKLTITEIDFTDPITGEFETDCYIHIF